jgi:hypothetical protein
VTSVLHVHGYVMILHLSNTCTYSLLTVNLSGTICHITYRAATMYTLFYVLSTVYHTRYRYTYSMCTLSVTCKPLYLSNKWMSLTGNNLIQSTCIAYRRIVYDGKIASVHRKLRGCCIHGFGVYIYVNILTMVSRNTHVQYTSREVYATVLYCCNTYTLKMYFT